MQHLIDAGIGQHHAGHAADGEQEDEADRPTASASSCSIDPPHIVAIQEKILMPVGTAMMSRRGHEIGAGVDVDAGDEHVVRPDHEADHADRDHRIGHAEIAEHRLLAEGRDHVADHAEARQDHDVDLGMTEEPEQMLEQHRIAAAGRSKNAVPKLRSVISMVIAPASTGTASSSRNAVTSIGPDEQRHLVQGHARRAHVEDRGDEVDGAQQLELTPARCSANRVKSSAGPL